MQFMVDPDAPPPPLGAHQEFFKPEPWFMPMPRYPESALKGGAPPATVAVRILIGSDGLVARVSDSPVMASTPGPFLGDFRAAVEEALQRWSFSPGRIDNVKDGVDLDGDGRPDYTVLVSTTRISVFFDVRFDFTIESGQGKVTIGASPAAGSASKM